MFAQAQQLTADPTGGPVWLMLIIGVVPAIVAAGSAVFVVVWQSRKTRGKLDQTDEKLNEVSAENTTQHGTSVNKMDQLIQSHAELKGTVEGQTHALDRVETKVDLQSERQARHGERLSRLGERMAVVEAHVGDAVMEATRRDHGHRLEVEVEPLPAHPE